MPRKPITPRVFIIDSDLEWAECIARTVRAAAQELASLHPDRYVAPADIAIFPDAISATSGFETYGLPDLIFLEPLLAGPDGYTFLNEKIFYPDTMSIPVILVTSTPPTSAHLRHYGVKQIFAKDTVTPTEILEAIHHAYR